MLKDRNLGPLLIILTFLLLTVGGYAVREKRWPGLPWSFGITPNSFELVAEAPSGGVVAGFPRELLTIAKDTVIQKSAKYNFIKNEERSEILTTTYTTEAGISELFATYIEYLSEHGYTILKTESGSGVSNIDAINKEHSISISIYILSKNKKEVRIDVKLAPPRLGEGVIQ